MIRSTYGFACSVVSYVQSTPSHPWSTVNDVAWKKYALSDLIGPRSRRAWGTYQLAVYLIGCGPIRAREVLRHSGTLCWCDVHRGVSRPHLSPYPMKCQKGQGQMGTNGDK